MPEEIEVADKVGSVSVNRYAEIVAELRKLVETASRIQFTIGDYALDLSTDRRSSDTGSELRRFIDYMSVTASSGR
ncbi:hypothetical protein [Streptomyces pseudovenezuelae]|uniref:Uncharacterized protein n=1 Tax=Streptomyces pseudovenezuelae TaxID=67350 RepID=A0ABT6M180_9ACTN|nr:hypothetical protein [Streptomyces pseudovenezuelae]